MNLLNSSRSYDDLIRDMKLMGYSECYIKHVQREICWIAKYQMEKNQTYEELYFVRSSQTDSKDMEQKYRVIYGIFKRYAAEGIILTERRTPLFRHGKFCELSPYYQQILNLYEQNSIAKGLKPGTYRAGISACSGLLLYFQNSGHQSLDTITEADVLKYFCDTDGNLRLSSSTKVNVAAVFRSDLGEFTTSARRVLSYLPQLKRHRKTISYFTNEEIAAIKNVLFHSNDSLNQRNRAIGTLLYFTGLRASDIAALQFSNIDWENELIQITQEKTEIPLTLPLSIPVGNAIYEYVSTERPECNLPQIFLSETFPFGKITAGTVYHAVDKICSAARIRLEPQDRKGAHLFRHHLATSMMASGISRPVISATLGHTDPESLNQYLYADISNLRKCSLSIEQYSVQEEVFPL